MIAILAPHKIFQFVKPIIFGLMVTLLLSSCSDLDQQEAQQVNQALTDSLLSTTETWNLDMEIIENGAKKVRLQGSYAASYNVNENEETRISGPVSIEVYDSTAAIKTWVNSDSAIYRARQSEFELFGDVNVRTRKERNLESEYLKWDQETNLISTPQFVIITTPTDSIAGTGFSGTSDLSDYTIKEPTGRVVFD